MNHVYKLAKPVTLRYREREKNNSMYGVLNTLLNISSSSEILGLYKQRFYESPFQ